MIILPQCRNEILIVAEIGKNYIQSEDDCPVDAYIANAKVLIDAAKETGADAVKFQTHCVEDEQLDIDVTSPHFDGSDRYSWVKRNTEATPDHFWREICDYCAQKDILFFSTPMSRAAARKLEPLDPPIWKVSSADVQDYVLLNELIRTNKPVVISTGMVSLRELDDVVHYFQLHGVSLGILYCVSHYPCPPEQFNLSSIRYFCKKYPEASVGFSDHSIGCTAALAAVKLGARIIEKHFSLSRDLWGPDHKASMTPQEFGEMTALIRSETFRTVDETPFLGSEDKELEGASNPYRPYFNKKLVAGKPLSEGEILEEESVYAMRPAMHIDGLESNRLPDILGKTIAKPLRKYDPIGSFSFS